VFLDNICETLSTPAVCIFGTPNIIASAYASEARKLGHKSVKSAKSLALPISRRFYNIFSLSIDHEVVHTGYATMAHYHFAIGVGLKL
jgi:hypothetical protein